MVTQTVEAIARNYNNSYVMSVNAIRRAWDKVGTHDDERVVVTVSVTDNGGGERDTTDVAVPKDTAKAFVRELLNDKTVTSVAFGRSKSH